MRSFLILLFAITSLGVSAQVDQYFSVAGELNFSDARIVDESGDEGGAITRFAPWFNLQMYRNFDKGGHGFFAGFSIRNIGFIYERGGEKWKCRTYNLGIPVGFKMGKMDGMFIYAGYEFEVPINYKEKYFLNEVKERKYDVWFSDEVSPYLHSGFVGVNFKYGFNVKFKYYFTEFFNPDYNNSGVNDPRDIHYSGGANDATGNPVPAREKLKVNVLYMALTWNMFRKPIYYYELEKVEQSNEVY